MTDEQLMCDVAKDDERAFEELVRRYGDRVYGLAFRFLRNAAAAEDVAQDTFLRVFTNRQKYKPTGKFSTWILTITANLCRSLGRRQGIVYFKSMDEPWEPEGGTLHDVLLDDEKDGPSFVAERSELTALIEDALQQLPEDRRMALLLSHFEGLDYKTISKIMDCSEGTVKSRVFRARAELGKRLAPFLATEPERVM